MEQDTSKPEDHTQERTRIESEERLEDGRPRVIVEMSIARDPRADKGGAS